MSESADSPFENVESANGFRSIDAARIVDSGPFGFITAGPSEIIDGVNSTLAEWLGYAAGGIVGKQTFQDLLAPGDRIYFDTHIRPMLTVKHEVRELAVQLVRVDGSRLSVLMNALLRTDESGESRIEVVVIDATERRRYEQELLHERRLAETSEAQLQVMYDVVSALAGATTVDKVIEVIADRGQRSIAGAVCSVWLIDAERKVVVRASSDGGGSDVVSLTGDHPALAPLLAGELLVLNDVSLSARDYPVLADMCREAGFVSAAVAPMQTDGALRGVIFYGFDAPHVFDESECRAMAALAGQTAQSLQRAQSIETERRSRARLESLFRFSTRLAGALTVDEVLRVIAGVSVDLLGASRVRLAVLADGLAAVRFVNVAGHADDGTTLDLDSRAVACAVLRTGDALILDSIDDVRDQYPDSPLLNDEGIGRVIAVPLVRDRDVLGAWVLGYPDVRPPDADDVTLLQLFAEQASQATGRAFFHENEAAARARSDVRLAISESLNAAVTTEDVAAAITVQGRKAFDASGLAVFVTDLYRPDSLELVASAGMKGASPVHDGPIALSDFVAAAGIQILAPVYLEGQALDALGSGPLVEHGWQAAVVLPMHSSGHMLGLIVVGFNDSTTLTPGTRVALGGLTAEASAAIGRARNYEVEHEVALTLQRSLLPSELPAIDGWTVSARYEPGSEHLVVGGDLFDVIHTDDGRLVVIVGDIVGHGLHAAASMGQLRSAARVLALVSAGPLEIIQGLEAFAGSASGVMFATVACVSIEPNGDGLYSCAGHPYPIVVRGGGSSGSNSDMLVDGRSALLGISDQAPQVGRFHMDKGDCLVLYTDGVIEHDANDFDEGISHLRNTLEHAASSGGLIEADGVVDSILGGDTPRDDIVVVCVTRLAG